MTDGADATDKMFKKFLSATKFLSAKISAEIKSFAEDEKPAWIIFVGILFGIRLILGRMADCHFFPMAYHDEALMINYADFKGHFWTQELPQKDLLVKDMGFPTILFFLKVSGMVYTDLLAILWFAAALLTVKLFRDLRAEKNFLFDALIFVFVLFTPAAFDLNIGTKIYRNAALTPLYFIVLVMTAIIFARHFIKEKIDPRRFFLFNLIFGVVFTLTFYVKEDGNWLLLCLIAASIVCLIKILSDGEKILPRVAILLLPLFIFVGGTVTYKAVNKIFFGVYLINNRTEGELGNFLKQVYKIKSDNRTALYWAPPDAIAKAFDASETLRGNKNLREKIFHTPWFGGDIEKTPIRGDFLGWIMLAELYESETCKTLSEQEEYLHKVNAELQAAFDAGTLQRDERIQIISSMGGLTTREIFSMGKPILLEYAIHLAPLYGYKPGDFTQNEMYKFVPDSDPPDAEFKEHMTHKAAKYTNLNFYAENPHGSATNTFIKIIFGVYSVIQIVLFIAAAFGVIWSLREIIRRKKIFSSGEYLTLTLALGSLILSVVYAFAIAWFSGFLIIGIPTWAQIFPLKYYSTGLIPMLMIFEIFGTCLFSRLCKLRLRRF